MKKLFLIICCLGIFFSIHAQDPKTVYTPNLPDKPFDLMVKEPQIDPPKFPECSCSKYYVAIGKGDSAMVDMKNGSFIKFQDGQQLVVKKVLYCKGESNCNTCQQFQWKIIDEAGKDLVAWSNGEVPTDIGTKMKCEINYKLVLQGRCGCTLCPPFIVNIKKTCCNCNALNPNIKIDGISEFCLTKDCNQIFTYSIPTLEPSKCFTYIWNIRDEAGVNVIFSGQSSNKISFSCKALKAGTYSIALAIKCQDKTINLTKQLVLCETPNAFFDIKGSGPTLNASTTSPSTMDYWILVDDLDANCKLSVGDVAHSINGIPMDWTLGNSISFSDLLPEKQYMMLHVSVNQCGKSFCMSSAKNCYIYGPAFKLMKPEVLPFNIMELPAKMRKGLPKNVFEMSNEPIKD